MPFAPAGPPEHVIRDSLGRAAENTEQPVDTDPRRPDQDCRYRSLPAQRIHGEPPSLILRWTDGIPLLAARIGQFRWLGAALVGFGIYVYVSSAARLLRSRTSAIPGAKPAVLVTDGWYACTRHPLRLGVVAILLGEAMLFSSPWRCWATR